MAFQQKMAHMPWLKRSVGLCVSAGSQSAGMKESTKAFCPTVISVFGMNRVIVAITRLLDEEILLHSHFLRGVNVI